MDGGPANRRLGKVKENSIRLDELGPVFSLQYESSNGEIRAQSKSNSLRQLKFKSGVVIIGRHFDPEIRIMLDVARETAPKTTDGAIWITEGWRPDNGGHGAGRAFDLRIRNVKGFKGFVFNKTVAAWAQRMRDKLGPEYIVIYGDRNHLDHIHVEWKPNLKLTIKAA